MREEGAGGRKGKGEEGEGEEEGGEEEKWEEEIEGKIKVQGNLYDLSRGYWTRQSCAEKYGLCSWGNFIYVSIYFIPFLPPSPHSLSP
jgi:hypothetical protein